MSMPNNRGDGKQAGKLGLKAGLLALGLILLAGALVVLFYRQGKSEGLEGEWVREKNDLKSLLFRISAARGEDRSDALEALEAFHPRFPMIQATQDRCLTAYRLLFHAQGASEKAEHEIQRAQDVKSELARLVDGGKADAGVGEKSRNLVSAVSSAEKALAESVELEKAAGDAIQQCFGALKKTDANPNGSLKQ